MSSDARFPAHQAHQETSSQEAWVHWETTRRELRAVTDRIAIPPKERQELLTALDRSHAALAAWLVTAHRPETSAPQES